MLVRRTDLALEARALCRDAGALSGVVSREGVREGFPVTTVEVTTEAGAKALGKPAGRYVTLELDPLLRRDNSAFARAARAVSASLIASRKAP